MQLFNEVNSRHLKGEVNVFSGIQNNTLFCSILLITAVLQVLIVEFGSVAFAVAEGGLEGKYWLMSLIIGSGSLVVQQIINLIFNASVHYKGLRMKRRLQKDGAMSTRQADGSTRSHSHQE